MPETETDVESPKLFMSGALVAAQMFPTQTTPVESQGDLESAVADTESYRGLSHTAGRVGLRGADENPSGMEDCGT